MMENLKKDLFKEEDSVHFSLDSFREKLDDIVYSMQVLLGRKSGKCQYIDTNFRSTFAKKHVRMVSVVLFLFFISITAIVACNYYMFHWKPCTKYFHHGDTYNPCA